MRTGNGKAELPGISEHNLAFFPYAVTANCKNTHTFQILIWQKSEKEDNTSLSNWITTSGLHS